MGSHIVTHRLYLGITGFLNAELIRYSTVYNQT